MSDQPILVPIQASMEGTAGVISAFQELKKAADSFGDVNLSAKLRAHMQALESQLKALAASSATTAQKMTKDLASDSLVETVRARRQRLQTEYEAMAQDARRGSIAVLSAYKDEGVNLFPRDKSKLEDYGLRQKFFADSENAAIKEGQLEARVLADAKVAQVKSLNEQLKFLGAERLAEQLQKETALDALASSFVQKSKLDTQQQVAQVKSLNEQLKFLGAERLAEQLQKETALDALASSFVQKSKLDTQQQVAQVKSLNEQLKFLRSERLADEVRALAAEKAVADQRMSVLARTARAQINQSVANQGAPTLGSYSVSEGANIGLVKQVKPEVEALTTAHQALAASKAVVTSKTGEMSTAIRKLTPELNDLHSATRGVASGFGAMWLTWGNIAPLLAGAAVSNAFVQAIKSGSEFQNIMRTIGELSGATAPEMAKVAAAALEIGSNSKYGAIEAATALKTLALAGLSTSQQLAAIKPTLDFATVAEMDIGKAAESLAAISTAFGYTATGFSAVGDVVAKAAAISMSSVSDMTEAFRQASTVGQQFGVSIKDAATTLALLAQVGIRGSAAGTAMRNMYNELLGSSKQAREILTKYLGVDIIDSQSKKVKDLGVIMSDLLKSLSKYDFKSQLEILNAMGNERGTKALSANLTSMVTEIEAAGGSITTVFSYMQKQLEDAPGFVAQAAIGMSMTATNQIKSVWNALQAAMISSFDAAQPAILSAAAGLRQVFNSEDFKRGLTTLVGGIATLTEFLVKNVEVIALFAGTWAASTLTLNVFAVAARGLLVIAPALGAAVGILTGQIALTGAAVSAAFGPIGIILAAVGVAWAIYAATAETAQQKAAKGAKASFDATMAGLDAEETRLRAQMKLRAEGAIEETLAQAARMQIARDEIAANNKVMRSYYEKANAKDIAERAGLNTGPGAAGTDLARARYLDEKLNAARLAKAELVVSQTIAEQAFDDKVRTVTNLARQDAKQAADKAERDRKNIAGPQKFVPLQGAGAAKAKLDFGNDNTLAEVQKRYNDEVSLVKAQEESKSKVLNAYKSAGLVSQSLFYQQEIQLARDTESQELAIIENERKAYSEGFEKKKQGIEDTYSLWKKNNPKAEADKAAAAYEKYRQEVDNTKRSADTFFDGLDSKKAKIQDTAITRMTLQAIALRGELKKVTDEGADFLRLQGVSDGKKARTTKLEDDVRFADPRTAAGLSAAASETENLQNSIDSITLSMERESKALSDSLALMDEKGILTAEDMDTNIAATVALKALNDERERQRGLIRDSIPKRAGDAASDAIKKYDKDALKPVTDTFKKNLVEGLRSGFREGQSFGDLFAQTFGDKLQQRLIDAVVDPIAQMATSILSDLMSASTGGGGGGTGSFITSAISWLLSANGNAFGPSGLIPFARGGVFDSPTAFSFGAGQMGVMGEAGPEAVMPLVRGADGRLGVSGGGSNSSVVVNQPIVINAPNASADTVGQIRALMPGLIVENRRIITGVIQQAMASKGGRLTA
jgi:TP901 family phage tail tape measure protein